MQRNILIVGKVITFLGITMYCGFTAYFLIAGDYEVHSTEHSRTIIMHATTPEWITLSPFVMLCVGSILWSIGQRLNRASN